MGCIVILVSAMELAMMGGWPTKDGRAGSGAFEFIRKGSGRKPGAAEAIFFAQNSNMTPAGSGFFGRCLLGKKIRAPAHRWVRTPGRDFVSAVWVELPRRG